MYRTRTQAIIKHAFPLLLFIAFFDTQAGTSIVTRCQANGDSGEITVDGCTASFAGAQSFSWGTDLGYAIKAGAWSLTEYRVVNNYAVYSTALAEATVTSSHSFTLFSEGLSGEVGSITLNISPSWRIESSLAGVVSNYDAQFLSGLTVLSHGFGSFDITRTAGFHGSYFSERVDGDVFPDAISLTLPYTFGKKLSFTMYLRAFARAGYGGEIFADAGHSMYWSGITNVTYQGREVEFSTSSDSDPNIDWSISYAPISSPVPEPDTAFMFCLGLLGICVRQARTTLREVLARV